MESKKVRFGIVGAGMISQFHAKAVAEIPQASVAAVSSRNRANAASLAEEYAAPVYTDYRKMIETADIDAVIVCTPSGAHMEVAEFAAENGKHVVVEKPLEITLERCDRIIASCEKNRVKLCTIFPSRFGDSSLRVKQTVESGRLGTLTLCDAYVKWWRSQAYYDEGGWKGTQALDGGGALMNQGIHAVDLLQWLAGDVASVQAQTATLAHNNIEVEDTAVASLRFVNGSLGTIVGATSAYPGFLKRIELSGNNGTIVLEENDIRTWEFAESLPEDESILAEFGAKTDTGGGASDPAAIGHEGHRRQLADFVRALLCDGQPRVDGAEGRKAVAIILAIYESAKTGKRVDL